MSNFVLLCFIFLSIFDSLLIMHDVDVSVIDLCNDFGEIFRICN